MPRQHDAEDVAAAHQHPAPLAQQRVRIPQVLLGFAVGIRLVRPVQSMFLIKAPQHVIERDCGENFHNPTLLRPVGLAYSAKWSSEKSSGHCPRSSPRSLARASMYRQYGLTVGQRTPPSQYELSTR